MKTPHDRRAWLALIASIIGAFGMLIASLWQTWILAFGQWSVVNQGIIIRYLGMAHMTTIGAVVVILLSLGLVIGDRKLKLSREGFEAEGGDAEPVAAVVTTTTTEVAK